MNGGWVWLSYALKTAFACCLLAWGTRRCVRDWTDDWDMRMWPVAVAVAVAIAVVSQSDEASVSLAGYVLVVVVARNVALVRRPAPRWQPSR